MAKPDWNPHQYLKFEQERTQPAIDLVARIEVETSSKIIDIGCGPGNSTNVLLGRWPGASIVGIDKSQTMIERAKQDYPKQDWRLLDMRELDIPERYDVVFSNAAIQWVPDQSQLLGTLVGLLADNGCLAVQIPSYQKMLLANVIERVALRKPWDTLTDGLNHMPTFHDPGFFYDVLTSQVQEITMWETDYIHIMDSQIDIFEMIKSTGLKPFLDTIHDETDKKRFEAEVLTEIKIAYPAQPNGKVLFPFKRLFFIAYK
ncbi:MAG: methyltransferase domain-containing protein [Candidatus Omnitrophica bacterium]|nr:methyltransferase domain-containing protein [Candidatus Omnitrophota bacterium]